MYYKSKYMTEVLSRLNYCLEKNPLLSGLQTDEHQIYLKRLATFFKVEIGEPNYEIEIEDLSIEEE